MARQSATQKRLITLRQGAIILAIFILSVFAFKYAQNIMRIRANQSELASLEAAVDRVKAQQAAADEGFVNSVSPGQVDVFAKKEMGWVKEGEIVYVPITRNAAGDGEEAAGEQGSEASGEAQTPPNWRLWLNLVTHSQGQD